MIKKLRKNSSLPVLESRISYDHLPIKCQVKNFYLNSHQISSLYNSMVGALEKPNLRYADINTPLSESISNSDQNTQKGNGRWRSCSIDNLKRTTKSMMTDKSYSNNMRKLLGINSIKFKNDDIFPLISSKHDEIQSLSPRSQFYILRRELKYNDRHNISFFVAMKERNNPYNQNKIYAEKKREEFKNKDYIMYPGS
ncbi:MAG: hypothetical protein MJ252_05695 [archaeon]|nr:hypothetical protein [archaeon]